MRQFEDRLRAELRGIEAGPTVGKQTMLARVVRARRRRTVAAGVGALAGCALALTIIVPTLGLGRGGDAASTVPRLIHEGHLVNVIFTDATHGYVVQERCSMLNPDDIVNPNPQETPDIQSRCEHQMYATEDAGATWQRRTLPADPAHKDAGMEVSFGHSLMVWAPSPGTLAMGSWNRRYWTTTDGGITWQESPTPYDIGPPGSYGAFGVDDTHVFLAHPPADPITEKNPLVVASDGSYWVKCEDSQCVRVTRNQGLTWQDVPLPAGTSVSWVATADGQTVYAVSRGATATLVRSTDGGQTWQEVPGVTVPFRVGEAIALPNGDLIFNQASEAGGLFRLAAGTTTVQAPPGAPAHVYVLYRTGGWLVAAPTWDQSETPDLSSLAYLSHDNGSSWIAVPRP